MLGAQDFCGYYDWTFRHIRKHFGEAALKELWAIAVGTDSQKHYIELGQRDGMKGLFDAWNHTGEDEKCDWTFTLDEASNVLRWDMRQCPSKGFLIQNDLHAAEDYCDHCIGWEKSMLGKLGMEMVHHEHNHCGQCWGEIRVKGKPYKSLDLDCDIRKDERWNTGHLDRFVDQEKDAARPDISVSADSVQIMSDWIGSRRVVVTSEHGPLPTDSSDVVALISARRFIESSVARAVVLIESSPDEGLLQALAQSIAAMAEGDRPLLLYAFLPMSIDVPFVTFGLPRPLPLLPLLIRANVYNHGTQLHELSAGEWLALLQRALTAS